MAPPRLPPKTPKAPKATTPKKATQKIVLDRKNNQNNTTKKQTTSTAPIPATPNTKDKKPALLANSVSKSSKKPLWKRRPLPAHSGVPVPEKMKQLFNKKLQDFNDSL